MQLQTCHATVVSLVLGYKNTRTGCFHDLATPCHSMARGPDSQHSKADEHWYARTC
jgi:hypothetical protein